MDYKEMIMITGRELRSTVGHDGHLRLSLEEISIEAPKEDEIIVRVEAAPINPTDIALLLGSADISSITVPDPARSALRLTVPEARLAGVRGRMGQSLAVGLEGAGTVVAAGSKAKALEGRLVTTMSGGMFADYRKVKAADVMLLPDGATAAEGASIVNPLTTLGFVETARREGHPAIIHTAAASNLGQILHKICAADGIPLVNIVRSRQQVELLRGIGAAHVLDSTEDGFAERLTDAIAGTGATVAFDAIGGGSMGSEILYAMERAAIRKMDRYVRTGSDVFKQLYIYGALDLSPTVLYRPTFGYRWSAAGWIVFSFLRELGAEGVGRLNRRLADELKTTFASSYKRVIGLAEALQPDVLRSYERKATGEKYLIDPSRG
jgi:NADPH2:quinone reductase